MHFDLISYYRKEQKTSSDWELSHKKKLTYINYAQMFADKYDLKLFVADNDMGQLGCSSECCGTEVLRDYKILGCNTRTQSFPKPDHCSDHLENVYVNFCRSKNNQNLTIKEVVEYKSTAKEAV